MNNERIILIVEDASLLSELENQVRLAGYEALVATEPATLTRMLGTAPVLVILDLLSHQFDWKTLLAFIKGEGKKANHVPVLGLVSLRDFEVRNQAEAAGCNDILIREHISEQLPHLIEKHKWVVDKVRCRDMPPPLLLEGIKLLNQAEFFGCHEVIEDAWNAEKEAIRVMYQGILQIGVACYHIQKKNWRGAVKVLARGIPKVSRFAPTCMGLDLSKLIAQAELIGDELTRLGPNWEGEFDTTLFPIIDIPDYETG